MIVRHGGLTNSQAMVYDAENRLKIFSQAGKVVVEFGYAADGARLWKRTDQSATNVQVWIGNIYEEKGGKILFHVFAGGQQVCTFETNSALYGGSDTNRVAYYYHEDNLNSSSALSGSGGSQLEVDAYYPFGRALTATPQASFQVSRRFTGQVFDAESGLYYYGSGPYGRYYDPELGRFIQADDRIPDLSNPQSYNRYSYCVNSPLRYTDPSGHQDAEPEVRMDIEVRPEPVSYPRGTMPEAEEEREIHSLLRSNSRAETIGPITESKPQTEEQIKAGIARSAKEITDATAPNTTRKQSQTKEGIYEFPDAKNPGKTYVGQSGNLPTRLETHENTGRKDPGTEATVTEVPGGKTQRELAEQKRIDDLGGTRNKPGSQTSNIRNPVSPERQKQLGSQPSQNP